MLVGYARVSTSEQDTDMQYQLLSKAGCPVIWAEKTSSIGKRPEPQRALSSLRPGDMLVVYKLDRLARSLKDLLGSIERLEQRGAGFQSLTEVIDTAPPAGHIMRQMIGAFAEFEHSLIRERSIAGQKAAKACGRYPRKAASTNEGRRNRRRTSVHPR